jgi:hypothetical protein
MIDAAGKGWINAPIHPLISPAAHADQCFFFFAVEGVLCVAVDFVAGVLFVAFAVDLAPDFALDFVVPDFAEPDFAADFAPFFVEPFFDAFPVDFFVDDAWPRATCLPCALAAPGAASLRAARRNGGTGSFHEKASICAPT